jgi:uncharacterized phage protein (TIGR01671 family)
MEREIKFRAWDKVHKKFLDEDDVCIGLDGCLYSVEYIGDTCMHHSVTNITEINSSKVILSQFTGLKDKKGVDVYEGDIVEWLQRDETRTRLVVKFEWDDLLSRVYTYPYIGPTAKIIGNVFENPELL